MADEPASTRQWMRIPPSRVRLADLHAWHPTRPEWVERKMVRWWESHSGDVYAHVVREGDVLSVRDGHHRLERERQLGRTYTWVRLYDPQEET